MDDVRGACAGVRELMLEAEPAELRGAGDSLVAVHVRRCVPCRELATGMLNAQRDLEAALDGLTGQRASDVPADPTKRRPSDVPLGLTEQATSAMPADLTKQPASRPRPSFRKRHAALALAPLAAAAMLVLLVYQQRSGDGLPRLEPLPDEIAMAGDRTVVNVTSGDDVAIMSTTNPNITVVWYLKRER